MIVAAPDFEAGGCGTKSRRPGVGAGHVVALMAAVFCSATQAHAISLNNDVAANTNAVVNIYDRDDTFRNVVMVHNCTGTLINARTVLTAAHCFKDAQDRFLPDPDSLAVKFSPVAGDSFLLPDRPGSTPHDRAISGVLLREGYLFDSAGNDMAIVSLDRPVTGIAPVTLVSPDAPEPAFGALAYTVGYGQFGTGNDGRGYSSSPGQEPAPYDGRRRIGQTRVGGYLPWTFNYGRDPGAYNTVVAEFRDPANPAKYDVLGLGAQGFSVPSLQAGNGAGDSGGPLFLVAEDGSLVQIGVLGVLEPSATGTIGYGSISGWEYVQNYLDWIYANNPLRSVSAAARAGAWSDAAMWSEGVVPENVHGGFDAPGGYLGRYYDVWLSEPSTVRVDVSPTIDSLRVTNPQATLDILPDARLTALVDTYVSGGRVDVRGTLDTGWLTQTGGVIAGHGAIVAPLGFVNSGGVVAPGSADALGTLLVDGSYAQGAGGTLAIRVDASGSDRLAVTGQAALDGTLSLSAFRTAPAVGQDFVVLDAAATEGSFARVSASLPALTFTTTVADGRVVVKTGVDYMDDVPANPADPEIDEASKATAASLTEAARRLAPQEAREAAAAAVIGQLPFPSTPALAIAGLNTMGATALGRALETLAPNGFYGQSAFARQTSQLVSGVLTDRLNALDGGMALQRGFGASAGGTVDAASAPFVNAYAAQKSAGETLPGAAGALGALAPVKSAPPATPFGVFVTATAIRSGAGAESSYHTYGLTAGIDYRVTPGLTFGAALTYADDGRTVQGTRHDGNAVTPALYGRFSSGAFFVDGYLGYAFGQTDTRRLVAYGDQFLSVRASPKWGQVMAGALAGVRLDASSFVAGLAPGRLALTPFIGLDVAQVRFDGYVEQGAGALSTAVASRSLAEARASAGIEAAWTVPVSFGVLTPRLKASVTQRFGDRSDDAIASYALAPDLPFRLSGAREARTYGSFGVALGVQSGEALSALVSYQADVSRDGLQDNRFSAKVRYRF